MFFNLDNLATVIISAMRTNMMGEFALVTLRTFGYIRNLKLPVGTTFPSPGPGVSSFWKWHDLKSFFVILRGKIF